MVAYYTRSGIGIRPGPVFSQTTTAALVASATQGRSVFTDGITYDAWFELQTKIHSFEWLRVVIKVTHEGLYREVAYATLHHAVEPPKGGEWQTGHSSFCLGRVLSWLETPAASRTFESYAVAEAKQR